MALVCPECLPPEKAKVKAQERARAKVRAKESAKAKAKARVSFPLVPVQLRMVPVLCVDQRSTGPKIARKLAKGRVVRRQREMRTAGTRRTLGLVRMRTVVTGTRFQSAQQGLLR